MLKTEWLLALAVTLLAGCQLGTIRVIHTPQPWQRWEYACMKPNNATGGPADITSEANKYGSEGWELAASDGTVWCFKRPVGTGNTPMSTAP